VACVCYYFGVVSRATKQVTSSSCYQWPRQRQRQYSSQNSRTANAPPCSNFDRKAPIDIDMDQTVLKIHDNTILCPQKLVQMRDAPSGARDINDRAIRLNITSYNMHGYNHEHNAK